MSRQSTLTAGRRRAEAGMADACLIRRFTGKTTDRATAEVEDTYDTVYTGKCRIQQLTAQSQQHTAGEDYLLMLRLEVQLPVVGTEGLEVGDEVTITSAVNDADLLNRVFLIRDLAHASEKTARRVQVAERTGS